MLDPKPTPRRLIKPCQRPSPSTKVSRQVSWKYFAIASPSSTLETSNGEQGLMFRCLKLPSGASGLTCFVMACKPGRRPLGVGCEHWSSGRGA